MTWPTKRQWQRQIQIQRQRQWRRQIQTQRQWQGQIHLENTFRERPKILVTFLTFDQSDEGTWPDQHKDNDKDKDNDKNKYILRTPSDSDPRDLWPLRHLIRVMRGHDLTKKKCDIWDNTGYQCDQGTVRQATEAFGILSITVGKVFATIPIPVFKWSVQLAKEAARQTWI